MTDRTAVLDPTTFRDVLGHYPTGVVVVTGRHPDGELLAMVVGTFTSVSLDPPLVAFLPMKSSWSFQRLRECSSLCINVLTGEQEHVGQHIVTRKDNKLEGLEWFASPSGDPVLAGSLAWLDVRCEQVLEAGDHYIALCRVADLGVANPTNPLLFFQGGYGRFAVPSLVARIDSDVSAFIRTAELARDVIEELAGRFGCESAVLAAVNELEVATVASAMGGGAAVPSGIGQRVPLIPPLGDVYVASAGPDVEEAWLARAFQAGDDDLAAFREKLELIRRVGYSVSFLGETDTNPYEEMIAATRRYSAGDLTPAQEREIRTVITRSAACFRARPIEADQRYDVGSIVVPVTGHEGELLIMLRLSQLPRQASGQQVRVWIEALQVAARQIAFRIEGRLPATTP